MPLVTKSQVHLQTNHCHNEKELLLITIDSWDEIPTATQSEDVGKGFWEDEEHYLNV